MRRIFLNEMFPVYGGKCLSRKAVHNWVEKSSEGRSKVADDARPGAEVAQTTARRLLCCGFRRNCKAMGHVCVRVSMLVENISRNKYIVRLKPSQHTYTRFNVL
jgi:hypothetical protein